MRQARMLLRCLALYPDELTALDREPLALPGRPCASLPVPEEFSAVMGVTADVMLEKV